MIGAEFLCGHWTYSLFSASQEDTYPYMLFG